MQKLNNMDMNNTPFEVAGGIISRKDSAVSIPNRFSSANGVNVERLARQINSGATKVLESISKLNDEIASIAIDEDIDSVTLDASYVKRIQSLIDNVYVSFNNLTKTTK